MMSLLPLPSPIFSLHPGLSHLCEFIEDCEHVELATCILNLLGREGPRTPKPYKYIRFIYNRVLLETPPVRAGKNYSCLIGTRGTVPVQGLL